MPASADYTVEADVYVASNLANDHIGVVGRMSTTAGVETYYLARYEQPGQAWALYRRTNGSWNWLGSSGQTLTPGTTYRLALDMTGTSIRVLVDGVERVAVTDGNITAAGRGGVAFGLGGAATTITNTTGMHLDNFRVSPPVADSEGTNHGDYFSGVVLGITGAIAGDSNTAATFDGTDDHVRVPGQTLNDFSVEFWFKSANGNGAATQWYQNGALVDADSNVVATDWGTSLRADGRVVAGTGSANSITSTTTGFDDNQWHHVVFTRSAAGALTLYVDGNQEATGSGATATRQVNFGIAFGQQASGALTRYTGSLDEVALYNAVLSGATVTAHYDAAQ